MHRRSIWIWAVVACVALSGCGKKDNRKPTFPVTGTVYVDGVAAMDLAVTAHNVEGFDQEQPTVSSAFTDVNGRFEISTYETGDGIPEGEYVLTFLWGERNLISMSYGGPDRLDDRYTNPDESEFQFTVEEGKPVDLGRIDLTTEE